MFSLYRILLKDVDILKEIAGKCRYNKSQLEEGKRELNNGALSAPENLDKHFLENFVKKEFQFLFSLLERLGLQIILNDIVHRRIEYLLQILELVSEVRGAVVVFCYLLLLRMFAFPVFS
jgi:hypothetical protein